jgi:hypothetical protein
MEGQALNSIIIQRLAVAAKAEVSGESVTFARQAGNKFCWLTPHSVPNVIFAADTFTAYAHLEKLARERYEQIVADLIRPEPE